MFNIYRLEFDSTNIIPYAKREETIFSSIVVENQKFFLYGWTRDETGEIFIKKIYPAENVDKVILNLLAIKGVILLTFSLLDENKLNLFFEVPDSLNGIFESEISLNFNHIKIEKIESNNIIEWVNSRYKFLDFIHIITEWKMTLEDMENSAKGILSNKMVFTPKIFCSDWSPIIGFVRHNEIKGNASYNIISNSSNGSLVEFNAFSHWFYDFFKNILKENVGPFIYWGNSDGRERLLNNFLIFHYSEADFLRGLRNHWREEIRKKHKNKIIKISNYNSIDLE